MTTHSIAAPERNDFLTSRRKSTPEVFDIAFAELGEFFYHRHILEHEDGGMMARIQVEPSPY